MSRLKDVYGTCKKEMKDTFERTDIVSVVRGKPGYANLNQLNVGSPGSDVSDMDDTTDLEELLAQGSSRGPQTHPGMFALATLSWLAVRLTRLLCVGIVCCAIFSFSGFLLLVRLAWTRAAVVMRQCLTASLSLCTRTAHCRLDREQQLAVHQSEARARKEEVVARHEHLPRSLPLPLRLWHERHVLPPRASSAEGLPALARRPRRLAPHAMRTRRTPQLGRCARHGASTV